jgi:uroporphyrinogen-III synthase
MMGDLAGKKIALLEARMGGELAHLVRRQGGEPFVFPALREQTRDASVEVNQLIDELQEDFNYIIFQTGVGVSSLFSEAEKLGRLPELLGLLFNVIKICRGPKPTAVLARHGLKPDVNAHAPYTTAELLAAIEPLTINEQRFAVLHYGERNEVLTKTLSDRGAMISELVLYEWQMPEDTSPLRALIDMVLERGFDAVAFTSQIQARHLFQVAAEIGKTDALRVELNESTVTASIGPTCSAALRGLGVEPRIEPEHPKMGQMVLALTKYFEDENRC